MPPPALLSDAQLRAEIARCEACEEKPCREACPARCSAADFILAARVGDLPDVRRAAAEILLQNPLGGVCGFVCPDALCMAACARRGLDAPIRIPAVQAALVERARRAGGGPHGNLPAPIAAPSTGRRVAVVGAGPAGLAAAAMLALRGHTVVVFDEQDVPGGTLHRIPDRRLPRAVLRSDVAWALSLGSIALRPRSRVDDPATLLEEGFHAVVVAAGLTVPLALGVPGEDAAVRGLDLLRDPSHHRFAGHAVVVGGGATAVDCAVTALERGARSVELIALETWAEMPLDATARAEVLSAGVAVTGRTRIRRIRLHGGRIAGLDTERVALPPDRPFHPSSVVGVRGSAAFRPDVDHVIVAIGARCSVAWPDHPLVVPAGDARNGPTYVVSAVASGKNAAEEVDALLAGQPRPIVPRHTHGPGRLPGWRAIPVPLDTRFFGRPIRSPFLLSAGPPTDGYQQMQRAYEAGWSGGVLKTAFDGGSVHIPGACMFRFPGDTWGNCDNVSDHPLDRACEEIARLVEAWPDRLTIGSTGGPITGDDERDRAAWVSNTRKLEDAGAMAIEYSLSCPQGGDGTEGDIVSQNARLTAKIVEWILEAGRPGVPKLFKLTAAVTSIAAIGKAIEEVLGRHPGAAAGVTLANTFPGLTFRWGDKPEWEEGIVVGLSGAGIAPVTNLTLASVAHLGVPVSGNGGAMDHHTAARFLALGAETVQFCSVILKYGLSVVDDLHSGLSHLMADRGIPDVATLVGRALPRPIRAFPDLSAEKRISTCDPDLCLRCGNCVRCPYLAIVLDVDRRPVTDPARCTGCGLCTLQCFAGALSLRERTAVDRAALAGA